MKLRNKTLLAIVATFSCLSLFCVGFANWAVGQGATSVTGTISAEEVSSYIEFDRVAGFEFGPNGFTEGDPYKATMSISYTVHPANIYKYCLGGESGFVTITVSLGWADSAPASNLLTTDYISAEVEVKPTGGALHYEQSGAKYDNVSGAYLVSLMLDLSAGMTDDLTLTVTYTVDFGSDEAAYQTYIFGPFGTLKDGATSGASALGFKFSAAIEGGAA